MSQLIVGSDGCIGTVTLEVPEPFDVDTDYQWSITKQPPGAGATLASNTGTSNTLDILVPGCYTVTVKSTSVG